MSDESLRIADIEVRFKANLSELDALLKASVDKAAGQGRAAGESFFDYLVNSLKDLPDAIAKIMEASMSARNVDATVKEAEKAGKQVGGAYDKALRTALTAASEAGFAAFDASIKQGQSAVTARLEQVKAKVVALNKEIAAGLQGTPSGIATVKDVLSDLIREQQALEKQLKDTSATGVRAWEQMQAAANKAKDAYNRFRSEGLRGTQLELKVLESHIASLGTRLDTLRKTDPKDLAGIKMMEDEYKRLQKQFKQTERLLSGEETAAALARGTQVYEESFRLRGNSVEALRKKLEALRQAERDATAPVPRVQREILGTESQLTRAQMQQVFGTAKTQLVGAGPEQQTAIWMKAREELLALQLAFKGNAAAGAALQTKIDEVGRALIKLGQTPNTLKEQKQTVNEYVRELEKLQQAYNKAFNAARGEIDKVKQATAEYLTGLKNLSSNVKLTEGQQLNLSKGIAQTSKELERLNRASLSENIKLELQALEVGLKQEQAYHRRIQMVKQTQQVLDRLRQTTEGLTVAQNAEIMSAQRAAANMMEGRGRQMRGDMISAAMGFGMLAAGPIAITEEAKRQFTEFHQSMKNIQSVTKDTDEQMGKWAEKVIAVATDPRVSAVPKEVAAGLYMTAAAGHSAAEAMNITEIGAKAATAGLADTSTTIKMLSGIMHAYKEQNIDASRAMDVLFKGVQTGMIRFEEFGQHMGTATQTAAMFKIPLEDIVAVVATLTNRGLGAAEAFTAVNNLMLKLADPTQDAVKEARALGIHWLEAGKSAEHLAKVGLVEAMRELAVASGSNLGVMQQLVPNIRALRGAAAFATDGGRELVEMHQKIIASSGAMENALSTQIEGTELRIKRMQAAWDAWMIKLGESNAFLQGGISGMTGLFTALSKLPPEMQTLIATSTAAIAMLGTFAAGAAGLGFALQSLGTIVGAGGTAGSLAVLALNLGRIIPVVGAVAGGAALLGAAWQGVTYLLEEDTRKQEEHKEAIKRHQEALMSQRAELEYKKKQLESLLSALDRNKKSLDDVTDATKKKEKADKAARAQLEQLKLIAPEVVKGLDAQAAGLDGVGAAARRAISDLDALLATLNVVAKSGDAALRRATLAASITAQQQAEVQLDAIQEVQRLLQSKAGPHALQQVPISQLTDEQVKILESLGAKRRTALLGEYLDISEAVFRRQELDIRKFQQEQAIERAKQQFKVTQEQLLKPPTKEEETAGSNIQQTAADIREFMRRTFSASEIEKLKLTGFKPEETTFANYLTALDVQRRQKKISAEEMDRQITVLKGMYSSAVQEVFGSLEGLGEIPRVFNEELRKFEAKRPGFSGGTSADAALRKQQTQYAQALSILIKQIQSGPGSGAEKLQQIEALKQSVMAGAPITLQGGQAFTPGASTELAPRFVSKLRQVYGARASTIQASIQQSAQAQGLDVNVFAALLEQESGFRPDAVSPVGAAGIAQFMPGTGQSYGLTPQDRFDPLKALPAAAKMLRAQMETIRKAHPGISEDDLLKFTLASYNTGIADVFDNKSRGALGVIRRAGTTKYEDAQRLFFKETRQYVPRILERIPRTTAPISTGGDTEVVPFAGGPMQLAKYVAQLDAARASLIKASIGDFLENVKNQVTEAMEDMAAITGKGLTARERLAAFDAAVRREQKDTPAFAEAMATAEGQEKLAATRRPMERAVVAETVKTLEQVREDRRAATLAAIDDQLTLLDAGYHAEQEKLKEKLKEQKRIFAAGSAERLEAEKAYLEAFTALTKKHDRETMDLLDKRLQNSLEAEKAYYDAVVSLTGDQQAQLRSIELEAALRREALRKDAAAKTLAAGDDPVLKEEIERNRALRDQLILLEERRKKRAIDPDPEQAFISILEDMSTKSLTTKDIIKGSLDTVRDSFLDTFKIIGDKNKDFWEKMEAVTSTFSDRITNMVLNMLAQMAEVEISKALLGGATTPSLAGASQVRATGTSALPTTTGATQAAGEVAVGMAKAGSAAKAAADGLGSLSGELGQAVPALGGAVYALVSLAGTVMSVGKLVAGWMSPDGSAAEEAKKGALARTARQRGVDPVNMTEAVVGGVGRAAIGASVGAAVGTVAAGAAAVLFPPLAPFVLAIGIATAVLGGLHEATKTAAEVEAEYSQAVYQSTQAQLKRVDRILGFIGEDARHSKVMSALNAEMADWLTIMENSAKTDRDYIKARAGITAVLRAQKEEMQRHARVVAVAEQAVASAGGGFEGLHNVQTAQLQSDLKTAREELSKTAAELEKSTPDPFQRLGVLVALTLHGARVAQLEKKLREREREAAKAAAESQGRVAQALFAAGITNAQQLSDELISATQSLLSEEMKQLQHAERWGITEEAERARQRVIDLRKELQELVDDKYLMSPEFKRDQWTAFYGRMQEADTMTFAQIADNRRKQLAVEAQYYDTVRRMAGKTMEERFAAENKFYETLQQMRASAFQEVSQQFQLERDVAKARANLLTKQADRMERESLARGEKVSKEAVKKRVEAIRLGIAAEAQLIARELTRANLTADERKKLEYELAGLKEDFLDAHTTQQLEAVRKVYDQQRQLIEMDRQHLDYLVATSQMTHDQALRERFGPGGVTIREGALAKAIIERGKELGNKELIAQGEQMMAKATEDFYGYKSKFFGTMRAAANREFAKLIQGIDVGVEELEEILSPESADTIAEAWKKAATPTRTYAGEVERIGNMLIGLTNIAPGVTAAISSIFTQSLAPVQKLIDRVQALSSAIQTATSLGTTTSTSGGTTTSTSGGTSSGGPPRIFFISGPHFLAKIAGIGQETLGYFNTATHYLIGDEVRLRSTGQLVGKGGAAWQGGGVEVKSLSNHMMYSGSYNGIAVLYPTEWYRAARAGGPITTLDGRVVGIADMATMHTGGIVGQEGAPWATRMLKADERLRVLQLGEEVLTRDNPRHIANLAETMMGGFIGGSRNLSVVVTGNYIHPDMDVSKFAQQLADELSFKGMLP